MKDGYVGSLVSPRLASIGIVDAIDEAGAERLERLIGLWLRYGRVMNLTSAKSPEELAPHLIEGILVVVLARSLGLSASARWLDVGSGAGFPGLIVAALMDVELTLIEPRERRASFIEVALAQIQRPGRVVRGHVERGRWRPLGSGGEAQGSAGPEPGTFDVASARAVFPLEEWLAIGATWTRETGNIFAHTPRGNFGALKQKPDSVLDFDQWSVCYFATAKFRNNQG